MNFFPCHRCHRCHRQVLTYETNFNICVFFHVTSVTGVTGKKIAKKNWRCDFFPMSPVSPVSPAKKLQKKWRCTFFSCHRCHRCHQQVLTNEAMFNICDFYHVTSVTGVTGKKLQKKNGGMNYFLRHQCHRQKNCKKMEMYFFFHVTGVTSRS